MKLNTIALGLCMTFCWSCSSDEPIVDYPIYIDDNAINYDDCRLVWSEEFDYEGLPNPDIWDYEEGYKRNFELQDYKREEQKYSRVENGKLILETHKDPHQSNNYDFEYSSASLLTKGKKTFKYGRIDIAAKIPTARGIFPVFGMLPEENAYGNWPASGEITIMEYTWGSYYGNRHPKNTISAFVCTENSENGASIKPGTGNATTLEEAYHLYSIVWKKKRIQILLDNKVVFTYDKTSNSYAGWPFDKDFHLLISLAVGGVKGGTWGVDDTDYPKRMEIDYIRYYELINDDATDEVEDPNLIKNAGFEDAFEAGKEPSKGGFNRTAVLDHLYEWYIRNTEGYGVSVDDSEKHSGTKSLLVQGPFKNWWDVDLAYPIEGVPAGKYTFSFWLKTDQDVAQFTTAITFCEDDADVAEDYHNQKSVVINDDGTQTISLGKRNNKADDVSSTKIYSITPGTEWTKYLITVELPETKLVKFVFKPCTKGTNWHTALPPANGSARYWFDDFSFEKVD